MPRTIVAYDHDSALAAIEELGLPGRDEAGDRLVGPIALARSTTATRPKRFWSTR